MLKHQLREKQSCTWSMAVEPELKFQAPDLTAAPGIVFYWLRLRLQHPKRFDTGFKSIWSSEN